MIINTYIYIYIYILFYRQPQLFILFIFHIVCYISKCLRVETSFWTGVAPTLLPSANHLIRAKNALHQTLLQPAVY